MSDLQYDPRATEFEKRRGISRVEVRHGFAQVHVSGVGPDVMPGRLSALQAVADGGISLDFLKLTPSGISFLVPADCADDVRTALEATGFDFMLHRPRSIVLVHAVNMRDEEGMIAVIVKTLIETGAPVDHVGDMHDRMLMVVHTDDAERVADRFRESL